MKRISWFSPPVGDKNGFGYAAVCLLKALNQKGVYVDYNLPTNNVHVSWVQPEWYEGEKHQYRIGYTPWESSEIPKSWPKYMNQCQEIWTPTTYCKEIFEEQGVTVPVKLVPHGVDPDHYELIDRGEYPKDFFVFLHVGGPTERKGAQRVFDAFIDLFDGDRKFQLILKVNIHTEVRYWDKGVFRPANEHPQVTVIADQLEVNNLAHLYRIANCVVYPSNGEGFGFIPFQGIATGCPTILTDGTGMRDFAHLSMPLRWTETDGNGIHLGKWMEPDPAHLRELMQQVVDNWIEEKEKAIEGGRWIQKNLSWDRVADLVIEILGDKI